ncbi:aldehyde dehydrogenase iron-sulfur subunit [Neoasaia chiangmaiensis]|nr:2Fe-2S iron-sulfur cluster-binding protein [Neoasaia chiangmaiensis]GEN13596.1 aldehyde dehydrogenase iron-sulfur subunit [Neoasaia chiangmaiensis]
MLRLMPNDHAHLNGVLALTRRRLVQGASALAVAVRYGSRRAWARVASNTAVAGPASATTTLTVNGQTHRLSMDARVTLLDLLRERLLLTGTKKGCDHGQCGACTVLINGGRQLSCLSLAAMHDGDRITTVEGLASDQGLHPVQAAFLKHDGFQCGYCTSGQICSSVGMLKEWRRGDPSLVTENLDDDHPKLTEAELHERMAGNICRCSAYLNIADALREAARETA